MQQENGCRRVLFALLIVAGVIGLTAAPYVWEHYISRFIPPPLPTFPTAPPYTPWPTPPIATAFDFPLLPAASYGPLPNTRYGVHNPAFGNRSNCFRASGDETVPFSQLYHAGVDLFALDGDGQVIWGGAAHAPVHAVADGVTLSVVDGGSDGQILIIQHQLAAGEAVYSVYWHTSHVQVQPGQPVVRGQVIAVVYDQKLNSHLHWEMRTFGDGSNLFPPGTAGARGTCNGRVTGVGYTWDDDPARAIPDYYGYLDPTAFIESRRP